MVNNAHGNGYEILFSKLFKSYELLTGDGNMMKLNKNTNMIEEEPYHYTLQDVEQPALFREIFSYKNVPIIPFNHRRVSMNVPKNIWITDTTFRDGQQSISPYSVKQIVDIFKLLHKLSGPKGIIRQTEFFVYSKKDKEAVEKCLELGYKFPEVTTWIRATEKDFEILKGFNIKETGILVSCSDYHIFNKLKMSRKQALEHYSSLVRMALEEGIRPRCHLEDITRADFYGFVIPFVNNLMDLSKKYKIPVKIRVCDTLGLGIPYPGVALPRSVPGIISGLQHFANIPSELIEWHGHNDFYKGVVNATTAWLYGASAVNCSLLGIGERTGNVPLEAMVIEYASLRGGFDGMDPQVITEIAEYYSNEIGYQIPPMTPYVGKYFNSTRAGIHADGILKDEEIYNIFDTKKVLNRPVSIEISNTSGLAGIAFWYNNYYKLSDSEKVAKNDQVILKLKEWVDLQYDNGRQTIITDSELDRIVHVIRKD